MPLYCFQCEKCEHEFEKMKKLAEENPTCPNCGNKCNIIITKKPVVRFKGEGFHCNDYDNVGRYEY